MLTGTPYSFLTRFENEKGTNPYELIAAAHAGCFAMTTAFILQGAAYMPTEIEAEAAVTIGPEGKGFRINRSALTLRAQVPNLDQAAFAQSPSGKALTTSRTFTSRWRPPCNLPDGHSKGQWRREELPGFQGP